MTRLFFQLFTPVFIVTSLYLVNINFVLEPLFALVVNQPEYEAKEIIQVLDESLNDVESVKRKDRDRKLKELQEQFLFDLDLIDIEKIHLPNDRKRKLEQGEFVTETDNKNIIYHLSKNAQFVWKLHLEQGKSETDNAYIKRIAAGPLQILINRLQSRPESEWKRELTTMSKKFELPLTLFTLDSVDIAVQDLKNLKTEGTIVFQENDLDRIYTHIPGTSYVLKLGPFNQPWMVRHADQIFFSSLGLVIGFVVWLLLRPVWRDLRKLQQASVSFGKGQLQTRVQFSRSSPVKTILQAFNGMAAHIQQLIASHKELTRAVSHELRTPVARMRFSLEMLEQSNDREARARYLREMNMDIDELDEMLGEMLSHARLDRDKKTIEYTPVLLHDWLREQALRHRRNCNGKTIQVSYDAGLSAQAVKCMDPKLMARALSNLIQNGCRYAEHSIHIHLEYNIGQYTLSVDDDGPGIPTAVQDKIFESFTRVNPSRGRDSGGYGLGLAIVKQIAEAHQGSVKVSRSELGGAKFILSWQGIQQ